MKNNLHKTKRGGMTTILVDFWSYLVFVMIILIFYTLFTFQSRDVAEITGKGLRENYLAMANFLKTPVNVDGDIITISDLIRLWHSNPDKYEEILTQKSTETLNLMEYDYKNPNADNVLVRGFYVVINSGKKEDNSLDHLLYFESRSFQSGFIINKHGGYGGPGKIQGEQFLPVGGGRSLNIVLKESGKAKWNTKKGRLRSIFLSS